MDRVRELWLLVAVLAGRCMGLFVMGLKKQCTVPAARRVNCHPQPGATQQSCEARGCTWCATDIPNAPSCFFSEDSTYGYSLARSTEKTAKGWR
uniref:P-type domain-containing protein n=1 Tax=Pavo cristatus TaxID=9049 RepID=A0A8C9FD89_PAVCR